MPTALAPPTERSLVGPLLRLARRSGLGRFQVVLGPRRVGKTTLMYQIVKHLLDEDVPPERLVWLQLDHPLLLDLQLGDLVSAAIDAAKATEAEPLCLFLDELVYAERWDLWMKTFHDQRYPVRILATSSATAALRERRLESGVGRWDEWTLTPFMFNEFLRLMGHNQEINVGATLAETIAMNLRDPPRLQPNVATWRHLFILLGGFPELLVEFGQDENRDIDSSMLAAQRRLRSDAVERAIYKDIPQSFGVDNPMLLERLLYTLAGQVTGVMSPKQICGELGGLSQPTFDKYVTYLERAFIVFTLKNFSGSEAAIQRRGRKLYFFDGAVRNAALQRGLGPLRSPEEMGLLIENLVASHLYALSLHGAGRLFYWRESRGRAEVDFVYDHPDAGLAFEVALGADHSRAGLRAMAERWPRFEGRSFIISPDADPIEPATTTSGVGTLPLDLFLVLIGAQLERILAEAADGVRT